MQNACYYRINTPEVEALGADEEESGEETFLTCNQTCNQMCNQTCNQTRSFNVSQTAAVETTCDSDALDRTMRMLSMQQQQQQIEESRILAQKEEQQAHAILDDFISRTRAQLAKDRQLFNVSTA